MAEEPVVAWVTAHGNLGTILNAVKSADIPVDDGRCVEWALNPWWGFGATVQFLVRSDWADAIAFVAPRLGHAMRLLDPGEPRLIFTDDIHAGHQSRTFHPEDASRDDTEEALAAIPAVAERFAEGQFRWDGDGRSWVPFDGADGAGTRASPPPHPPDRSNSAEADPPAEPQS